MLDFKTFKRVMYVIQAQASLDKEDEYTQIYNKYLSYSKEEREQLEEHLRDKLVGFLHDVARFYNDSPKTSEPKK